MPLSPSFVTSDALGDLVVSPLQFDEQQTEADAEALRAAVSTPTALLVLLDRSASVTRSASRLQQQLVECLGRVSDAPGPLDVAVHGFDGIVDVRLYEFVPFAGGSRNHLAVYALPQTGQTGTPLVAAVAHGLDVLRHRQDVSRRMLVVLTDGAPTDGTTRQAFETASADDTVETLVVLVPPWDDAPMPSSSFALDGIAVTDTEGWDQCIPILEQALAEGLEAAVEGRDERRRAAEEQLEQRIDRTFAQLVIARMIDESAHYKTPYYHARRPSPYCSRVQLRRALVERRTTPEALLAECSAAEEDIAAFARGLAAILSEA